MHNFAAMEELARAMHHQTVESQLQIVVEWMGAANRDVRMLPKVSDILEKVLGFGYFTKVRGELTEEDYVYFLMHLVLERRDRGSIIIEKGKKNDSFYIILQGEIVILD